MKKLASLIIAAALGLVPTLRADDVIIPVDHKECGQSACAPKCDTACPDTCNKTCVPATTTKIVEKRCYSSKCEQFCVPRCSMPSLLKGGCGKKSCDSCNNCAPACDQGSCHKCGKVRTRKVLIVRIKKEEECVPACEVADCPAPVCAPAPCAPACKTAIVECAPAKKTEALPTPPKTTDPMKK